MTLLYFGYTHCPDVCPLTMSMLAQAVKALPAATVRDRSFVGLTGSRTAIIQAQRQVGAPPSVTEPLAKGSYGVDHGAFIYAYGPDDLAHIVYFQGVQPAALAADLRRLAAGALPAT